MGVNKGNNKITGLNEHERISNFIIRHKFKEGPVL